MGMVDIKDSLHYYTVLKRQGIDDIYNYIVLNKIVSIDKLQEVFELSKEELYLDVGVMYGLGCILVKYGLPMKFIAITEQDAQERFIKRFRDE